MSNPGIELLDVGKRYGHEWALRHLELKAAAGTCVGLLGRNGAGKTTTLRLMAGLLAPDEGAVRVRGLDPCADRVPLRRATAFTGDDVGLYPRWTLARTLRFAAAVFPDWRADVADRLLRRLALRTDRRIAELSAGNLARLKLLLALARAPGVLLIDEPFGGLDVVARRQIIEELIDFIPSGERTIVITSHLVHELEGLVEHIAVVSRGRTSFTGTLDAFRNSVRRVKLSVDGTTPEFPDWVVRPESWGRGWEATIHGFSDERLRQLEERGFSVKEICGLPLEDVAFEHLRDESGGEKETVP